MSKKLIAFLISLCLVLSVLISCAEQLPPTNDLPDSLPPEQESPAEEQDPHQLAIAEDGVANYRVIWDDGLDVSTQLSIQNVFQSYTQTSKIEFELAPDEEYHPNQKEILIGKTDRVETEYGKLELQGGEYVVSYHAENDRILILGDTDQLTFEGLQYFLET